MSEKDVEGYLVYEVVKLGGIIYKFTVPGRKNIPDRLVLLNNVPTFYVELKDTGEEPRDGQWREIYRLRAKGAHVYVASSKFAVDTILMYEKEGVLIRPVSFIEWKERKWII